MNQGKISRHDRADSSSITSPACRDRTGSVSEARAGSVTGSRAGSVVETGSRAGSKAGSETGSRAGSRVGSVVETESETERWSGVVVRAGRGSKGRYSTVGASETIGNRSSGESLSRDGHNSNRDSDSDGGVEYGARGGSSDVPCDYGKHTSERKEREVEGDEDDEERDEGDEGDEAKSAVILSHNVTEGHSGLYKGPETSRWFGRGGGVRGQVDNTPKISIDFHDRYRGPPRSHMDAGPRVDPRAKGNFGISRRDEIDAFKNSLRSEDSGRDRGSDEDENEIEDGDSYNTSSHSVVMHSCANSDGASTGSERIYRPDTRPDTRLDTRLISRSRSRTGSDVSTRDEGMKSLGVQSRECKVKPLGDRRKDFKDDRSHSEHSNSQLPQPDILSPSMLLRSAAGSRSCVIYDEVKLNEGKGARGTSDVRLPPHSQPKSRTQSLNCSMDGVDSRITEMARKSMLEKEYVQKMERAIGKDDEERAMARVTKQREREEGRERERAMEKDEGRKIAREEDFKRSGDRKRHTIEIVDRDSSSGPNGRNNPSHRQSVHASVYGSADAVDEDEDEEEEEEGLGNSMSQQSVTSYEEYRSTRPTFITEKVRDPEYPGTGTGAGHYNHLWVTAEDHEMHVRALSDQLKCADEAAIQSHLERQEDMKRMKDNMLEDKVRYTEGQRRAEEEKEALLEEFNIEKEKSKALQALLGAHSRGHALGSHSRGHALGSLLEGGDQEKKKAWERETERGASWDTALFSDSTRSTERLGAGVSADYSILREAFEAQLAVLECKIIKRDESLKLLELDCNTKEALLVTLSERVKEDEDIFNARADSRRVQEQALEQQKGKNRALLDRVDEEEGRYTILEGHRDQDLELFRAEKNDLKVQLSSMMREMTRLRGDALDRERDSNARWEEAEGRVEEAVKDRKEVVKRHEKSVKALAEEHRAKELKVRLTTYLSADAVSTVNHSLHPVQYRVMN